VQEGIYKYSADDGSTFQFTTFLLVVECALNVAVGAAGAFAAGRTTGLPQSMFALTGATQIAAKFFTNAAMATGVSFPTQVLRKLLCAPCSPPWYRALLPNTPPAFMTSTSTPSAHFSMMHNRLSRRACQSPSVSLVVDSPPSESQEIGGACRRWLSRGRWCP
jgi:hypothetical protein